MVYKSSLLASDNFPLGAMLSFSIVVIVVNGLIKVFARGKGLSPQELGFVFIMALVSTTVPTFSLVIYAVGVCSAPYYFASPENEFAKYIFPHLKSWTVVQDKGKALEWFYEGLPQGESIPWAAWLKPMGFWISLGLATMTMTFFLVVIFRRQWMEKENLPFPLAQIPLSMVEGSNDRRFLPKFMRTRLFWMGFVFPFAVVIWNMLNLVWPTFPQINLRQSLVIQNHRLRLSVLFPVIGFTYFVNIGAAFSIWFFWLVGYVQNLVFSRLGIGTPSAESYHQGLFEILYQEWGAMIAMVLMSLFVAREHIRDVLHKAFCRNSPVDDSRELTSYRTAVVGFAFCVTYLIVCLYLSGLTALMTGIFVFTVLIVLFGLTRIVIECGIINLRMPVLPQVFTVHALGVNRVGMAGLTSLGTQYAWFCDIKAVFMAAAAHADKLRTQLGMRRRETVVAIFSALIISALVCSWFIIRSGYHVGAYNCSIHAFQSGGYGPYRVMIAKFRNSDYANTNWKMIIWMFFGAGLYCFLNMLRFRFIWWPLHPIGMTINTTLGVVVTGFSVFLGWLCKWMILKFGGAPLYHKCRPFFLGLILGHFFGVSIAFLLDVFYFGVAKGHMIHGW